MIDTTYAVNCLKQGFQRYIRYNKINATIDCGDNYVSFYVKGVNGKQYLARGSNHHLKMQHLADKDEPWNGDNISIVFITPNSPQDTRIRGRVRQNHYGGIKPFSVTTYQYDNTILDESDLRQIFYAITVFLNGKRYTDPFAKTPKAAKVIPRNSNIKPYKEPSPARNISVDKDGNYVSANAWGADYISENKQYKTNTNMNKKLIRLTESDLHRIVKESVKRVLKEDDTQNLGINNYDPTNYDELNMKIKAIMSKVSEIRNMIKDISTSQLDVAQNAGNLDGLAEELYRQLRYTLHKANTSNYIEA